MEALVNESIKDKEYGSGISSFDVVFSILPDPPKEHTRYNKSSKDTDIRLTIDYESFVDASEVASRVMIGHALLDSIDRLSKKDIKDFDFNRFKNDISGIIDV